MGSPRISVRGLAVRRGDRTVLDHVSFDVEAAETFGLLGPNGAGKSTTFQILTGLLRPSAGELELDGRPIAFGARELRRRIGVVFQEPALDKRLTARENLRLAARLQGVPGRVARRRIEELLAESGLDERGNEPISKFSGGMRRRVDLVRALLHEPGILILDEPTAGLDEAAFRRTWTLLTGLRERQGLSIVLTTHRPEEAEQCTRIAILDRGRIVACDTPDALRTRVSGDLIVIEADQPEELVALLAERAGVAPRLLDGRLVVESERGHELIPRLVEALPDGRLHAISLRRTGLAEVFLELTGHDLYGHEREDAA